MTGPTSAVHETDPSSDDPWVVLGLEPGASPHAVAQAWRRLAAGSHPDVGGDPARFRRLAAARDELVVVTRRGSAAVTVVRRPGAAASLLRPLRRRVDRHLRPRVH